MQRVYLFFKRRRLEFLFLIILSALFITSKTNSIFVFLGGLICLIILEIFWSDILHDKLAAGLLITAFMLLIACGIDLASALILTFGFACLLYKRETVLIVGGITFGLLCLLEVGIGEKALGKEISLWAYYFLLFFMTAKFLRVRELAS